MSAPDDAATETENGSNEERADSRRKKQPFLSGALSVFIAGLGQVYNGQYLRGSGFILLVLVIMLVSQVVSQFSLEASAVGVLVHAVAAYDAYVQAQRINAEATMTDRDAADEERHDDTQAADEV